MGIVAAANVVGFGATAIIKSEVLVDLMGTGAIGASAFVLHRLANFSTIRSTISTAFIVIWSARLSSFLAVRAAMDGDARLQKFLPPKGQGWTEGNNMKRLPALATFWTLQAVWGLTMLLPQIFSTPISGGPASAGMWGLGVAAAGLLIECIADFSKFAHKRKHGNQLYTGGLYSIVRYPNYSGEILFWTGLGIYYLSSFGANYGVLRYVFSLAPAAFVTLLLLRASGIPLTEKSRSRRFANDASYLQYCKNVPHLLIPKIF